MRVLNALLLFAATAVAQSVCAAEEGKPAPLFEATLMSGEKFSTADSGDVVMIHYWATWCEPCRKEMPDIEAYYRRHREQGLRIVAVSMDDPDDIGKVRDVMRSYSFPAAMAADVKAKGYGRIWRIPLSFLVDRQGILRKDGWSGPAGLDDTSLEQEVTPLLKPQ
jgi:cytochrome c biogenesis protein CcmG/thiol:disulfide interchange protein DsbE